MRRSNFRSYLLACLIVIFAASLVGGAEGITVISKDQLKEDLTKPDVIVIDVRTDHDWDSSQWKIQGAQRQSPNEDKAWMGKYSKDKKIVLYCA
jgi:rhodanese-related sulfurtransferase